MRTRPPFRRTLFLAAAVALTVIGAGALPVSADEQTSATFVVNSTDDIADGTCDATHCTLREAITAANATTTLDRIEFDGVTTITPTTPLPHVSAPVSIDGGTEPDCGGVPGVVLDGRAAGANGYGLLIGYGADGSAVRGLTVSRFGHTGLLISASATRVECSYFGTDVTATSAVANGFSGVFVDGADNLIGGTGPGRGNVIAAHELDLALAGNGNVAQGNLIGTDITGTVDLGTGSFGGGVQFVGTGGTLGGATPAARNVVTGGSRIVGMMPGTTDNLVEGNYIGVDVTGNVAFPNWRDGVDVYAFGDNATTGNVVRGNVIGGYQRAGVVVSGPATDNVIEGNSIGIGADGTTDVTPAAEPHQLHGVYVEGPQNTVRHNHIAHNWFGVTLRGSEPEGFSGVTVSENAIDANGGLGIDLGANGVTANDALDTDTGHNDLQNYPEITAATSDSINARIASAPNTTYRIEAFASASCDDSGFGEGARFIGTVDATTDAGGTAAFDIAATAVADGEAVTATATAPDGSTSEFSRCATVAPPALPTIVPGAASVTEGNAGTVELEVPVTLSAPSREAVTAQWRTVDTLEQPQPAVDYVAESGTVAFLPGQTSATVSVTVVGDSLDENQLWGAEWGVLQFGSPTNGVVGGYAGLGFALIVDDDPPPVVRPVGGSVSEGHTGTTTLNVRIDLSTPSGRPVSVDWSTVNTTAQPQAGVDFAAATGTLVFAPGETTKTIPITVYGDTIDEPGQAYGAEWGSVSLGTATNATYGSGPSAKTALALIVDDD